MIIRLDYNPAGLWMNFFKWTSLDELLQMNLFEMNVAVVNYLTTQSSDPKGRDFTGLESLSDEPRVTHKL